MFIPYRHFQAGLRSDPEHVELKKEYRKLKTLDKKTKAVSRRARGEGVEGRRGVGAERGRGGGCSGGGGGGKKQVQDRSRGVSSGSRGDLSTKTLFPEPYHSPGLGPRESTVL